MSMSYASPDDLTLLKTLSARGALIPFEPKKFYHSQAVACCSDGMRLHMPEHLINLCRGQGAGKDTIMFRYEVHGTAMRLGLENPLSPDDLWWRLLLPLFEQAQRFVHNEIQQYNMVHHWPCGAALESNIGLLESILLVAKGKVRLKRFGPFREVTMLLWTDISESTYRVDRIKKEAFLGYLQELDDQSLWEKWQQHEALLELNPSLAERVAA